MSKARNTRSKKQNEIPQQEAAEETNTNTKDESKDKLKSVLTENNESGTVEKRVLRPKRSYSSLPKPQAALPPNPKTKNNRKRKNSSETVKTKKNEEESEEGKIIEKKSSKKIPALFEDSPDENEENVPAKNTGQKTKTRKTSNNKLKKCESASNLSVSATATTIVNSVISNSSSINEQIAPKSIMKTKQNKSEETEENKKPKRGVKIQDDLVKSELLGVKCDRHKYSASTSTPSGLRRKPLKAPQDVSMICKPDTPEVTS
ncbi:hypothetical protein BpHYR1_018979 [Brachionus plicatilis]|uniref:Uncharacterized protein n=1 Tax=Brachionus plicatilis TaxID=10195 RepID=A0A3M7RP78_BRAPC|nr:hypothetical protein BpHYR1_018979 [Brachionus plicatilis]